ncbi:MAG: hypothetical protein COA79_22420 [Planctomycetota bacterium]|nr:MAG: hypothetical protein COA79_22420 [Planctomycetota bacterium]
MNRYLETILFSIKIIVGVVAVLVVLYSLWFILYLFSPFIYRGQFEYNAHLYFKVFVISALSGLIVLCLTGNLNKPLYLLAVPVMYISPFIIDLIHFESSSFFIKIGSVVISGILTSMCVDSYFLNKAEKEKISKLKIKKHIPLTQNKEE